ncbi:MAG TPA: hypothetical protein VKA70_11410 [Blastocatellia bacterium]|nr:hypothetical protein [Blastocatellia bacterium]
MCEERTASFGELAREVSGRSRERPENRPDHNPSAVVGSITVFISDMRSAGNPP